jgi:HK97 family phage portal protein
VGILSRVEKRNAGNIFQMPARDPVLAALLGRGEAAAGVDVNEHTALNYSAVWAAVNIIAGSIASLPLILYRRLPDGGKERATNGAMGNLHRMLHDEPNPEMTSYVFREALQAHVLTWGNGYAEIERNAAGRPIHLWPLRPDRVRAERTASNRIRYRQTTERGPDRLIPAEDMLHIPGLGFDGLVGYSVIGKARDSISLGLATERFGATFFGNGSMPGGVLKYPQGLKPDAKKNIVQSWERMHQGPDRAHKIAVLEHGLEWQQIGLPPEASQFLETRKFQTVEVARWFNLPPHKLADLDRSTNNNIEHQSLEFVMDTLRRWLVRWEQELNRKLIPKLERGRFYTEHLIDALLRGDIKSRYDAYAVGRQWGWLSADDVREKENMNPLPGEGGKLYLVPVNMTTPERIQNPPEPPAPEPAAEPESEEDDVTPEQARQLFKDLLAEQREQERQVDEARAEGLKAVDAVANEVRAALEAIKDALTSRPEPAQPAPTPDLAPHFADLAERLDAIRSGVEEMKPGDPAPALAAIEEKIEAVATTFQQMQEAGGERESKAAEALRSLQEWFQAEAEKREAREAAALEARKAEDAAREEAEAARFTELRASVEQVGEGVTSAVERMGASVTEGVAETVGRSIAENAESLRAHVTDIVEARVRPVEVERDPKAVARIVASHRAVVIDAVGQMVRREANRARLKAKSREGFRDWVAEFYPGQREIFERAIRPAIAAHLSLVGGDVDPDEEAKRVASAHVERSVRELLALADEAPENLESAIDLLVSRWEIERPAELADEVASQEVVHTLTGKAA